MIQISNSIEIARPVTTVFAFVADYRNNPQWMPVESVRAVTTIPVGNGTVYKEKFFVLGAYYEAECRITFFDPEKKLSFTMDSAVFGWNGSYAFESSADGTQLTVQGTVELRGPVRVAETMFAPRIRELFSNTAPNLKRILESQ